LIPLAVFLTSDDAAFITVRQSSWTAVSIGSALAPEAVVQKEGSMCGRKQRFAKPISALQQVQEN
jgi:hypothetical protein